MKDKELLSMMMEDAADFRAQSLEKTLRVVRGRRRVRRCGQALAMLALFGTALWWTVPRRAIVAPPAVAGLDVVSTGPTSVEIVSTSASSLNIVGDEELLELVPGETKLLVWHAPNEAELVILDGAE